MAYAHTRDTDTNIDSSIIQVETVSQICVIL